MFAQLNTPHMKQVEKIGRFAWIGFIVSSAPCAVFCAAMAVMALRMLSVEDGGPIESLSPTTIERCVTWTCLLAHPLLWTASIFLAHRFNDGLRATLPFVLNLVPVAGLLWIAYVVSSAESQDFGWPVWYLGIVAAMLLTGLIAVIASSHSHSRSTLVSHA